jgi:hypothetical protein
MQTFAGAPLRIGEGEHPPRTVAHWKADITNNCNPNLHYYAVMELHLTRSLNFLYTLKRCDFPRGRLNQKADGGRQRCLASRVLCF